MTEHVLAYNTNGFYHHRLDEATRIIADAGYTGIALTPDLHHLDPFRSRPDELEAYGALLERLGLDLVIETGARFILDPVKKHYPSLITPGQGEKRFEFLLKCVEMARILGARIVSFHSGGPERGVSKDTAIQQLAGYAVRLCESASSDGIKIAVEPEPGMVVETMNDFLELKALCSGADLFLTIDVGHVQVTESKPVRDVIRAFVSDLVNVHLDDAAGGRHEHLPLGTGEIDFTRAFEAIKAVQQRLFLSLELSRHGHEAVDQARKSMAFLSAFPGIGKTQ